MASAEEYDELVDALLAHWFSETDPEQLATVERILASLLLVDPEDVEIHDEDDEDDDDPDVELGG